MTTIYFDTHFNDDDRRRHLYSGDVFVYSPVPEEIVRLYDPNPPEDREELVYKPPGGSGSGGNLKATAIGDR